MRLPPGSREIQSRRHHGRSDFSDALSSRGWAGSAHQRHYAFGIDQWFLNTGAYVTTKATSGAGQLSCGSGVEAEFVDDLQLAANHGAGTCLVTTLALCETRAQAGAAEKSARVVD